VATCLKCGAALSSDAVFCSSCGSPTGAGAPPPTGPGLSFPGIAANVAGLLCYLLWPVASIFFLLVGPYNKDRFVRFHAYQSLLLGVAAIAVGFALSILTAIVGLIPILGWLVSSIAWIIFAICLLVLAVFMMSKAYNGERYKLPVIGDVSFRNAEKA
jgi:uncharacterized membrane protein